MSKSYKTREHLVQDAILKLLGIITGNGVAVDVSGTGLATESTLQMIEAAIVSLETAVNTDSINVLNRFILNGIEQVVNEDTSNPANNTPLPVKLVSADGPINITAGDLNVQLSHIGSNFDSCRIGDGVNLLTINADGSINTSPIPHNSIGTIHNDNVGTTVEQITLTSIPCKEAKVSAHYSNTGRITIGGNSITDGVGEVLYPTESVTININNVNKIYVVSEIDGDKVTVTYTN